jgi:hypothetical protein
MRDDNGSAIGQRENSERELLKFRIASHSQLRRSTAGQQRGKVQSFVTSRHKLGRTTRRLPIGSVAVALWLSEIRHLQPFKL